MSGDGTPCDALVQFLYQSPIGLLQATMDGSITMANPMSAQLLMPLATDGALDNLFALLAAAAPRLREQAAATAPGEPLRLTVQAGPQRQVLGIRLVRLDAATLMASVADITASVQQEQRHLATQLRDAARKRQQRLISAFTAEEVEQLWSLLGRIEAQVPYMNAD